MDSTNATLQAIHAELREIKALLAEAVTTRLNATNGPSAGTPALVPSPILNAKAIQAIEAREQAKARGFHTVSTFARVVGRHENWVSARCKARVIQVLPGGKPYKIPLIEEIRYNGPLG